MTEPQRGQFVPLSEACVVAGVATRVGVGLTDDASVGVAFAGVDTGGVVAGVTLAAVGDGSVPAGEGVAGPPGKVTLTDASSVVAWITCPSGLVITASWNCNALSPGALGENVRVANTPVPSAPGGMAPSVRQTNRMEPGFMRGSRHWTLRPLLARKDPCCTPTKVSMEESYATSN
jgi:hypothetical protein